MTSTKLISRSRSRFGGRYPARHAEPSKGNPLSERPIAEVWREFLETRTESLRNFLMEQYLHLVRYNAERIHQRLPNEVDVEDLMSVGVFGLKDAIENFDLERKVKFETYCAPRIRGAILDELRSMDWVPRLVRHRTARFESARQKIEMETGHAASDHDVANRMGLEGEEWWKLARDKNPTQMRSIHSRCYSSDSGRDVREIDVIRDEGQIDPFREIQRSDVRDLITRGLSRTERLIVLLYYFEGMTMREIGETLDLSESRVSQMHTSILQRLKVQMQHRSAELEEAEA